MIIEDIGGHIVVGSGGGGEGDGVGGGEVDAWLGHALANQEVCLLSS